jgi:hypothetical protein
MSNDKQNPLNQHTIGDRPGTKTAPQSQTGSKTIDKAILAEVEKAFPEAKQQGGDK